jgi:hypothetical protein
LQFSLRTVLAILTGSSVFLGVAAWAAWSAAVIIPLSLGTLGILVTILALRRRRRGLALLGGLLMVFAVGVFANNALTVVAWVGRHKLDVHVTVLDASALTPLPNATVEVLYGPESPIEGGLPDVARDFRRSDLPQGAKGLTTDERGHVTFTQEFFAAGQYSLFRDSGYVSTGRVWLRVTATGYRTTYMPLDRQSGRPRDIHDETPLFVTVPVGRE